MTSINSEIAVEQLFHECGLRTWQDDHRRYIAGRMVRALLFVLAALILGIGLAWLAPGLLHAVHQTQAGASNLRQSIRGVG